MDVAVFSFQPFESRVGRDEVIGLRFAYDPELVARLKAVLLPLHAQVRDRAASIHTAGGWLSDHRCWFVELAAWPDVRAALQRQGHALWWEGAPAVPDPAPVAPPDPAPPTAPPERTCGQCRTPLAQRWVTLIYAVAHSGETVLLAFCTLTCLRAWLAQWAGLLEEAPAVEVAS